MSTPVARAVAPVGSGNRRQRIDALTRRFEAAADDWSALAAADQLLAASLPAFASVGPWQADERAAVAALREAHRQAQARCGRALDGFDSLLSGLRARREGWLAYALVKPTDEVRA